MIFESHVILAYCTSFSYPYRQERNVFDRQFSHTTLSAIKGLFVMDSEIYGVDTYKELV